MYSKGINVRVCVNGRPIKEYRHDGLLFIESRNGTTYSIKVTNDNGYRVMAIVSVDGLDVITGKPAEETNTGYVIDSYSSTEIKGYRISDSESAAYVFSSKGESYVASMEAGDVRNAGVIGVRVIREKERAPEVKKWSDTEWVTIPAPGLRPDPWKPYQPYYGGVTGSAEMCVFASGAGGKSLLRAMSEPDMATYNCSVTNAFDSKQVTTVSFDTGTAWGGQQQDKVRRITFDRGEQVAELVLYYSSAKALEKMGIDMADTPIVADGADDLPKPFGKSSGYCTPPKNWKRNV